MIPISPTPYPDLNAVLQALLEGQQAILAGKLIGVYLQGSFAVGDFDAHSDVDFIAALRDDLAGDEVEALTDLHGRRIYDLPIPWAQHLEGSYFPQDILRPTARAGEPVWYLGHGSRELVRSNHCNTVVVRWTVREHGVTLAGPAPADLIDPIPVDVLRADILTTIRDWGGEILAHPDRFANRFYQGYLVLNFSRMLRDCLAGDTGSKRMGAEWAKAHLDPSWAGLIDRAWATRPDPASSVRNPADPDDFRATLDFVRYVIEISRRYEKSGVL